MCQKQSVVGTLTKSSRALVFLLAVLLAGGALLTFNPAGRASAASPTGAGIANVANGAIGDTCDQIFGTCPNPGEWCSDFAKWVWQQAGITKDVNELTAASSSFYDYGANHNGSLSNYPEVGDVVVLGYNPPTNYAQHVAVVTNVDTATQEVTWVGGNEGGGAGIVQQDGPFAWAVGGSPSGQVINGYIKPAGVDDPAPLVNDCPASISQGQNSQGSWVDVAKYALNSAKARGVFGTTSPKAWTFPLQINGKFDQTMTYAVFDFQSAEGLSGGGGQIGDRTWSRLGFCEADFKDANAAGQNQNNCPDPLNTTSSTQVWDTALQDLLNFTYVSKEYKVYVVLQPSGFYFLPYLTLTGQFGTNTYDAVVDYQYGVGIGSSGNGQVGNRTWSELGMCY